MKTHKTMNDLGKVTIARKSGTEEFHSSGKSLGFDLKSFWQWSRSDLLDNTTRGIVAEYLVERALGMGEGDIKDTWNPCDIETPSGIRIQVKSSAYIQAWHQNKLSGIIFDVQSRRGWDSNTNVLSKTAQRHSDIYVFALLAHKIKATIDPMNVDHWQFFVLPTEVLDKRERSQRSITLKSLEKLCSPVGYHSLKGAIETIAKDILSGKVL